MAIAAAFFKVDAVFVMNRALREDVACAIDTPQAMQKVAPVGLSFLHEGHVTLDAASSAIIHKEKANGILLQAKTFSILNVCFGMMPSRGQIRTAACIIPA